MFNFWTIIDRSQIKMYGHMTDCEKKQKGYINLTQVNEISKYNIIIPKQKNEKGKKAGIEYETLKWRG